MMTCALSGTKNSTRNTRRPPHLIEPLMIRSYTSREAVPTTPVSGRKPHIRLGPSRDQTSRFITQHWRRCRGTRSVEHF
ncbi:hypothetical protein PIB30_072131 [Stylosanthes scabra]|uniref:Uncharacterized protein n=1 Tax=Stylosanthes scabra TaxID=79078 RepID=A0ABU6VQU2_9FABA|nr:hypothetical protein [Stylosanthes scabra]